MQGLANDRSLQEQVKDLVEHAKMSDEEFRQLKQLVRELDQKQKEAR